ncbi:MAG: zf-TFIIB domain-containing protein [Desulfuromonadales bacterium]|nr:zf-TFIIB domain-containing protein [Desulfuromonadales bacterium]
MNCPACPTANLIMTERQGVEIDYCPECRGVWLDRGELDKIIERANAQAVAAPAIGKDACYRSPEHLAREHKHGHPSSAPYDGHGHSHKHPYKKKKSLLSELFDFD